MVFEDFKILNYLIIRINHFFNAFDLYENEFKVRIVELLLSGIKTHQVSEDYDLNVSMINRWKRQFKAKSGDFTQRKELTPEEFFSEGFD